MGDAVLDFAVVSILYDRHPLAAEGKLTSLKMKATNNMRLGEIGVRIGLYKMLFHANPVFTETFQRFESTVREEMLARERNHSLSASSSSTIVAGSSVVVSATVDGGGSVGEERLIVHDDVSAERGMFTGAFSFWAQKELGLGITEEEEDYDDDEDELNEGR